ncbi:MAG: NarK/NasA family nitrate transporter [Planctomycetia bacterium]|nr:NarK/NasA family nitrate transporter [Planctomycetia bacterium]
MTNAPVSNEPTATGDRRRVLWLSTIAFTLLFNVWLMLGVLGIPIRKALELSDAQFEWLISTAILAGAMLRLNFGIWADRFGGRNTMVFLLLFCSIPTYLFSQAASYPTLLVCTLLYGLAGNSFAVGIAWNSAWFPQQSKGTALGIFGAGNVGAAGTKLLVLFVPTLLTLVPAGGWLGGWLPGGWRAIPAFYAIGLIVMAGLIVWLAPKTDPRPVQGRSLSEILSPLRKIRVWRLSLYYVVVFGAYVALSGWLPRYYVDTYGVSLQVAALYTATFIFPASLLRPLGGWLSDRFGPRVVTYAVFLVMTVALALLMIPSGGSSSVSSAGSPGVFAALLFVVGCGMGIGKASVYKYIPDYFPDDVGAVGGLVGLLGALGGFILPPIFGLLGRWTGVPQMAFVALLALTAVSLAWLHVTVLGLRAAQSSEPANTLAPAHLSPP